MPSGPHIKLALDLQRIANLFPPDSADESGYDFLMEIDRPRYDLVEAILEKHRINDPLVIQEFCFIILWIENYIGVFDDQANYPARFLKMWQEIDDLKDYLLKHRVTSITFTGENGKKNPGAAFSVEQDINIDRICDGVRSVFREEFQSDKQKRQTRGRKVWKTRKMVKVRNYVLKYMARVPGVDHLSLEDQSRILDKLSFLSGIT